jgi:hypothetical protein
MKFGVSIDHEDTSKSCIKQCSDDTKFLGYIKFNVHRICITQALKNIMATDPNDRNNMATIKNVTREIFNRITICARAQNTSS